MRGHIFFLSTLLLLGAPAHSGALQDAAKKGDIGLVRQLLERGEEIDGKDSIGTALHWSSFNGHVEVAALLISRGAELDATSDILGKPLHAAAQRGHAGIVELLLTSGADVDARNRDAFTPLMFASAFGSLDVAALLIGAGADLNAVGVGRGGSLGAGNTIALHLAVFNNHRELTGVLLDAGAEPLFLEPDPTTFKNADAARGRESAEGWCSPCHMVSKDQMESEAFLEGPDLTGVYGRKPGTFGQYEYSDALRNAGGIWTEERLFAFVMNPMLTVPGTKMIYVDGWQSEQVANIVAYFKSLAN